MLDFEFTTLKWENILISPVLYNLEQIYPSFLNGDIIIL